MKETVRILNVEDVSSDSELAEREIKKVIPSFDFRRVETREEYLKALAEFNPNIVVSDYNLPTFNGLTALKLLLERTTLVPLIILTGSMNEDTAVECIKAGATDYVIKEHVKRLGAAVVNALEQQQIKNEKEHAKAEAREKQNVIEKITRTIPMEVYIYDLETKKYLFSNRYLTRLLGYKPDELYALGPGVPGEVVHPEDQPRIKRTSQQYQQVADIEVLSYEYRVKDKSGIWHWIQAWEVISERSESGAPSQILGTIRDITEKRNAEEKLRVNELKYRSIFENIQDVYYEAKPDGLILEVSPSIASISNYTREDILGKNLNDLYASVDERKEVLAKLQKNHIIKDYEVNMKDKDGSIVPCAISARFVTDETDKSVKISGIMRDTRERKKNEENIRLLISALESAANAIAITDNQGIIMWSNHAFTALTGFTNEEVLGENPRILKSGLQPVEFYKDLWDSINQGKVWKGEMINQRKNKELYTEEMTITPVKDHQGNIINFVAIKNDITERKKAENELIKAKEKAEESDRLKTVFLQNLSHEIRTPMNAIIGFSDLLETNIYDNEKMKYCTHIIKDKSHDLLGIINDILDISLIEAGQMIVYEEKVDLDILLKEIHEFFDGYKSQIGKGNIELKYSPIPDNFNSTVVTDKTKLNQIFNNLLFNAFKFTDAGEISYGYHSFQGKNLQFFISDTGMGIPSDKHTLIFERFRQADEGVTRKKGGVGLGLAIVKGLVELLEGKIRVVSESGKGSTFYFTIPVDLSESKQITTIEPVFPSKLNLEGKVLLIIEDDFYNQEYLIQSFEPTGARMLIANTGKEAVEKLKEGPKIDIVLLDVGLPDINGLKLVPVIKDAHPGTVVVALTAYATKEDKEKCLTAGCDHYISKPADTLTIMSIISQYC
jgi:PAS domain S-box-containing protein